MFISKRAKVTSTKPLYSEKIKTDNGYIWVYDSKAISQRVKEKKHKLELLKKSINKLKEQVKKDLKDEDLNKRAVAAVVSIINDTGMRIGNELSAASGTFGASTLKVEHLKFSPGKVKFDFIGKKSVPQLQEISDSSTIKVLKELVKGKKGKDFVFEIDGVKIWDRKINRYLEQFEVSCKDLRGFYANELMKEILKHKDWEEALKETAEIVGHEENTLKNSYLDPELVQKYEKKLNKKAEILEDIRNFISTIRTKKEEDNFIPVKNLSGVNPNVKLNSDILNAWNTLRPFLPHGVVLTSGVRTIDDQIRIINEYWKKSGADLDHPEIIDPVKRSQILKDYGLIVAAPGKSPHSFGKSFDLSGGNLNEIARIVKFVSEQRTLGVNLKTLIEPKNNAVHITIYESDFRPTEIVKVLNKLDLEMAADDSTIEIFDDFISSNPPEKIKKEILDNFKTQKEVSVCEGQFPKKCNCGKIYNEKEFKKLPIDSFIYEKITKDDPGIKFCLGERIGFDLLYRNCECGTTLAIKINCVHK